MAAVGRASAGRAALPASAPRGATPVRAAHEAAPTRGGHTAPLARAATPGRANHDAPPAGAGGDASRACAAREAPPAAAAREPASAAVAFAHEAGSAPGWRRAFGWPLAAFAAWCLAWALYAGLRALGTTPLAAFGAGCALAASLAAFAGTRWRRSFVALGFPLSMLGAAAPALAAPLWLLPLALLALLYPLRSWRDAPLFPTPRGALAGLAHAAPLAPGARVVDLGCGVGDGLRELRRAYPHATLEGIEWSRPLRFLCALRCRGAAVARGDIWAADWSAYDLVYLFQRPESMARAAVKASAELRPGAWLVSLEFAAPGLAPERTLECAGGRKLWVYRPSSPGCTRDRSVANLC